MQGRRTANLPKRDSSNRKGQRKINIINRTPEHPVPNTEAKTRFNKRHKIHKQNAIRYYMMPKMQH